MRGRIARVGLLLAPSIGACRGAPTGDRGEAKVELARGDVVVVERAAAEFFQGRVLSVAAATLKVQTSEEGEPVVVARSDAYRVPPSSHVFAAREPAVCAESAARWAPCRVVSTEGDDVLVLLDTGEERHLDRGAVIVPSAVTALNVERHFETMAARQKFDLQARAAGTPSRPPGWVPERREPVIARHGAEWFSAHVAEMLEDGGVRVVWDGEERAEAVRSDLVVPAPPVSRALARGDFALCRPATASQPWERVRIEAIGPSEAVVIGIDGTRRRLDARILVPLVSAAAPR